MYSLSSEELEDDDDEDHHHQMEFGDDDSSLSASSRSSIPSHLMPPPLPPLSNHSPFPSSQSSRSVRNNRSRSSQSNHYSSHDEPPQSIVHNGQTYVLSNNFRETTRVPINQPAQSQHIRMNPPNPSDNDPLPVFNEDELNGMTKAALVLLFEQYDLQVAKKTANKPILIQQLMAPKRVERSTDPINQAVPTIHRVMQLPLNNTTALRDSLAAINETDPSNSATVVQLIQQIFYVAVDGTVTRVPQINNSQRLSNNTLNDIDEFANDIGNNPDIILSSRVKSRRSGRSSRGQSNKPKQRRWRPNLQIIYEMVDDWKSKKRTDAQIRIDYPRLSDRTWFSRRQNADLIIACCSVMTEKFRLANINLGDKRVLHPAFENMIAKYVSGHSKQLNLVMIKETCLIVRQKVVELVEAMIKTRKMQSDPLIGAIERLNSFKFSETFLYRLLERNNLELMTLHGEASHIPRQLIKLSQMSLHQLTSMFPAHRIYNADESALLYKQWGGCKVAVNVDEKDTAKGFKDSKERLSFMLTVNGTGSDRWELVVVNGVYQPQYDDELHAGIQWYSNPKGWMTSPVFRIYLLEFDRYVRENLNYLVLLLVDNCSSHLIARTLKLTHVLVAFLPANTTAHLQPLDAGVIKATKQEYYALAGQGRARSLLVHGFDLQLKPKAASNLLKQAFSHLTCNQIKTAFLSTGIMTEVHREEMEQDEKETSHATEGFEYENVDYEYERKYLAEETYDDDMITEIDRNMSLRQDRTGPMLHVHEESPLTVAARKRKIEASSQQSQSRPRIEPSADPIVDAYLD